MYKWYLPTLSEMIALGDPGQHTTHCSPEQRQLRSEREWSGAIAALNTLLQAIVDGNTTTHCNETASTQQGVVLSGALPVLDRPELIQHFFSWTFTPEPLNPSAWIPPQLLPASDVDTPVLPPAVSRLLLVPDDPLHSEQFCLALTPNWSLAMALGEAPDGTWGFWFSFVPDVVWGAWQALRSRLVLTSPQSLRELDTVVGQYPVVEPDYRTITHFSRSMIAALPDPVLEPDRSRHPSTKVKFQSIPTSSVASGFVKSPLRATVHKTEPHAFPDVMTVAQTWRDTPTTVAESLHTAKATVNDAELLRAIAHEVRTPLTTIRTLTRLLLKRTDLHPDVLKRLKSIDRECTEQIDRFNLIFRAVEWETTPSKQPMAAPSAISLSQLFQQSIPRWQQQASQHDLTLEAVLPQKLPLVLADSTMLDQMLAGLIDRITHTLPPGSHIQVRVKLAGHQLKLQFLSFPPVNSPNQTHYEVQFPASPPLQSLGDLLMFQPETGSLSLNLAATKNLFQMLGGKLIVRQRPHQAEELTIFLPLETHKSSEE